MMRVVALVRAVRMAPDRGAPDDRLAPCDAAALRTAVEIAHTTAGEVIALAAGNSEQRALSATLDRGATRALCVTGLDPVLLDYLTVARALAAVLRRLEPDLILCGHCSGDEALGAMGPALGELLGMPHVSGARSPRLDDQGSAVEVRVPTDRETRRLRLRLPAVVAVGASGPGEPIPAVPRPDIETVALGSLVLDTRDAERRVAAFPPAIPSPAERRLSPDAPGLVACLRSERLL